MLLKIPSFSSAIFGHDSGFPILDQAQVGGHFAPDP